jgi:hypothetical protein
MKGSEDHHKDNKVTLFWAFNQVKGSIDMLIGEDENMAFNLHFCSLDIS